MSILEQSNDRLRQASAERYRGVVAAVCTRVPGNALLQSGYHYAGHLAADEGDFLAGLIRSRLIAEGTLAQDCIAYLTVQKLRKEADKTRREGLAEKRELATITVELDGKQAAALRIKAAADLVVKKLADEAGERRMADQAIASAETRVTSAH